MLIDKLFDLKNKIVVISGGNGFIGSEISCSLAEVGCKLAIFYNSTKPKATLIERLEKSNSEFQFYKCNVTNPNEIKDCKNLIINKFGGVDVLINCAGGNHPDSTTSNEKSFFDIPSKAFNWVLELNMMGTILPCQIFGEIFAQNKSGSILNISSMAAIRPLTKIPAYSSSKAAINNFTKWLSVHMAKEYSENIRVNAIAPGFFLGKQNRFLLIDENSGEYTERGKSIIDSTPLNKFGEPKELISTVIWLLSNSSNFVTGVVVPVDGGFNAFGGV